MDPTRKRKLRLGVALTAAALLAGALAYTSFGSASEVREPSQLLASAASGRTYQLTGKVVPGSVKHQGSALDFAVRDRDGKGRAIAVSYRGSVPDPFRGGREIVVDVKRRGSVFVGQRDTLSTKCPSKFSAQKS